MGAGVEGTPSPREARSMSSESERECVDDVVTQVVTQWSY